VIASKLNLRAGPGPSFPVVTVMPAGSTVTVQQCGDEWCRVKFGAQIGYASRAHLGGAGESYASAAPTPAPAPDRSRPTLGGPQVWQWDDPDWRNSHWRRLGWHNRHRE
jgi:uncharacterized protein YraI